jgi:hypothetical protein
MTRLLGFVCASVLFTSACSSAPGTDSLRDSFAQQLAANTFISEFQRSGDNMTFKGPRPDGAPATWRVQITSASVEPQSDAKQPYKGTVASSWYVDGQEVKITGGDSNLPIELTENGLSQDCWAFWQPEAKRWSWE